MRFESRIPLDSLALCAMAVAVGALIAAAFPFFINLDGRYETLNAARTLAETGTLANPFNAGPTGPTAHVSPVFPAIAALLRLLPFPWKYSLLVFALLLCGLNAALMPCASQLLFGSRKPGHFAGLLSCFAVALMPQHDVILSCVLGLAGCCAIASGSRWAPLLCAVAILSNPACSLPLAWCAWTLARPKFRTTVLATLVLIIPWILRNWITLGAPSPVRDNFGLELSVSNSDCARPLFYDNVFSRCFQNSHPNYSRAELAAVRTLGETRYNSRKLREAVAWITAHLSRFAQLTAQRAFYYLFPSALQGPWALGIWIVTVIAFFSLFVPPASTVRMLQVSAILSWLPYAAIQSDLRYRTVSLWCWLLLAGLTVSEIRKSRLFRKERSGR